jgi:hypothetical protein
MGGQRVAGANLSEAVLRSELDPSRNRRIWAKSPLQVLEGAEWSANKVLDEDYLYTRA